MDNLEGSLHGVKGYMSHVMQFSAIRLDPEL